MVERLSKRDMVGPLLYSLFENSPLGFACLDRKFRYVYVNQVLADSHRLSIEDHIGKTVGEVVPDAWPKIQPLFERAFAGRAVVSEEVYVTMPDGKGVHWLATYYPLREGDETVALGVVVQDVSRLRQAEEALLKRNQLYAMLSQTSRSLSRCRTRDELFEDVCAIAVGTGKFKFAWIALPTTPLVTKAASAGDDHGYLQQIEVTVVDGDARSDGPTGRCLREGEPFVVNDFAVSNQTTLWRDVGRRVGFAASAAFPLKERGKTVAALTLYADERGFFTDELVQTLREITPIVSFALDAFVEEREHLRDEAELHLHARERVSLEAQLRHAQKMEAVGRLAAGVAHDFNNMLCVIMGSASLALNEIASGSPARDDIDEILRAGERATELTRQLLAFSRQQPSQRRAIDLGHVLTGMEKLIRRMVGESISLELAKTPGSHIVIADPNQIEQVIMNLVVNGRDAMPSGGRLTIELSDVDLEGGSLVGPAGTAHGPYTRVRVRDTGVGMDPVTRERIFEPFFTTKELGKGTGLGLSVVFGIVSQSDGHIEVESEVGQGTTFSIYLPRTTEALLPQVEQAPAPDTLRGTETVLVVEDSAPVRAVTRAALQRSGYTVLEAANGGEAFLICEEHGGGIDLLITDMVMPRMNGRELAQRLRRMKPGLRVLFVSGYSGEFVAAASPDEMEDVLLQKPFTPNALLLAVRQLLDR